MTIFISLITGFILGLIFKHALQRRYIRVKISATEKLANLKESIKENL